MALAIAGSAQAATLYAPVYSPEVVHGFSTAGGDELAPLAGSPFDAASGGLTSWIPSPEGDRAVGAYLGPGVGGVRGFAISADGSVAPAQAKISFTNIQGTSVAWAPSGNIVYVATRYYPGSGASGVRAYSVSPTGQLTELAGSPFVTAYEFWDLAITPDGKQLFASASSIYSIPINGDGSLGSATPTGMAGERLAMVPTGTFLLTTYDNGSDGELRSYEIAANGSLTQRGMVLLGGTSFTWPAVSPDGRFAYAADSNSDQLTVAALAPEGTLTQVGAKIPAEEIETLIVSPDGTRLYYYTDGAELLTGAAIGVDGRPGPALVSAPYDPNEPVKLSFRSGRGTSASFSAEAASKPLTMQFNGLKSTAIRGSVTRFDWEFGDGGAAANGGAAPVHMFAKPGVYSVKLTAYDDTGCAERFVFGGQTALCAGAAGSVKTVSVNTPPWITKLRVGSKKISFRTTEPATVTFVVQRPLPGRTVGKACKRQTAKNKKAKKCTRWVTASKKFSAKAKKGNKTYSLKFNGSVKGKKLARGSYRLSARGKDKAKGVGPAVTAKFRVKR